MLQYSLLGKWHRTIDCLHSVYVPTHAYTHTYIHTHTRKHKSDHVLFMQPPRPGQLQLLGVARMAARNFTQLLEKLQKIENVRERINFYCVTCNAKLLLFMASCV